MSKQIEIPASLTVRELAQFLSASPISVIKVLMSNGVMANINQQIDFETAEIVAAEMGFEVIRPQVPETTEDISSLPRWRQIIANENQAALETRPPVVTILGHVDHGKTTLLDAIRHTNVAEGEVGGITQHIGAYQITHHKRLITFLDTPGHAAFTAMRARGAQGADIVVLVVAADDGVMPQTREAIDHAQAAHVPIIVALNKMDKANANPERVKQQLAEVGLVPDEWGGDTIIVPMSAKQKKGLDDLMEAILLVSDNMEILANPAGEVIGTVIEAQRDRGRGVVATLLVQNGTLRAGQTVIVGQTYGKLRAMFDYLGKPIRKAGPSTPVSVMGLRDVPGAGELFEVVENERQAREILLQRADEEGGKTQQRQAMSLEQLFSRLQSGEISELRLIVKADVQGSIEPIVTSLQDLATDEVKINVLHASTGNIGENDVMLATASDAVVLGFNVQADSAAQKLAEAENISVRTYDIIYRMLEDVEKAIKGMLAPEFEEEMIGHAEVRAVFAVRGGQVAGCRVLDGVIRRNAKARLLRQGEIIHEGELASLKHHQEDVREMRQGFECGINLKNYNDYQPGDIIECYIVKKKETI
ncbi:MAG: hypothetical protein Fur0018_18920 [Anaerolineales bacterium]